MATGEGSLLLGSRLGLTASAFWMVNLVNQKVQKMFIPTEVIQQQRERELLCEGIQVLEQRSCEDLHEMK